MEVVNEIEIFITLIKYHTSQQGGNVPTATGDYFVRKNRPPYNRIQRIYEK